MPRKTDDYLGDGLYARESGGMVTLSCIREFAETSDTYADVEHYVCLEPEVLRALIKWAKEKDLL